MSVNERNVRAQVQGADVVGALNQESDYWQEGFTGVAFHKEAGFSEKTLEKLARDHRGRCRR